MRIVDGVLKEYAWGRIDGLVPWTVTTGRPQAELWFGAHPSGASPIVTGGDSGATLADVKELDGLPLVKILAAAIPLSIQIHPDAAQALAGFAAQQADRESPRLYADAAEKTEMLVALTDFDTHAGWRDPVQAAAVLAAAGAPGDIVHIVEHGTRSDAVRALLGLDHLVRERILDHLIPALVQQHWAPDAIAALVAVTAAFPGDPGVLVTVLLRHHRLAPGQALVVPAGVVHSYVSGLAVEVMTCSDNVLRLGLTPKQVAVDEAVGAIRADRMPVVLDDPGTAGDTDLPFTVVLLDGPTQSTSPSEVMRTVLCLDGRVTVDGIEVPPGRAAVFEAADPEVMIEVEEGRAVLVTAAISTSVG